MKSNKMSYIIYADFKYLIKKYMDAEILHSIYLVDIQCHQFGDLII